ncbi:hypothetical protein BDK51DRAFT_37314 [Blyttiomyces helicus]|uniref:Uncharacterized protein n=1 Tax=Blyttiomyces helicus TaxID=388810 RepID=A0A4V1IQ03_9FUNG|nr:hypothetical protein BDK51DRAFT_37314 [Blyttiomyces helicus]|eukprot:RKO84857.1 hypothetical protein BDK51DRAFT_37314 [Blyttiomyces helicus]
MYLVQRRADDSLTGQTGVIAGDRASRAVHLRPVLTAYQQPPAKPEHVVLLLCGPESSLASERRVTFTCGPCDVADRLNSASLVEPSAALPAPNTKPDSGKRKKGPVEHCSNMACCACTRSAGVGQIQVRNSNPPREQRRREDAARASSSTGKAPLQLQPRAHGYTYESRRCPDGLSSGNRSAVFSRWVECRLRGRCTSKELEASVKFRTYANVATRCESSCLELANFISSEPAGIGCLIVPIRYAQTPSPPPPYPHPLWAPAPA